MLVVIAENTYIGDFITYRRKLMLAELKIKIETDSKELSYYQSSNMQGVLMEYLDPSYAAYLHKQGFNPYSQHLELGEENYWVIKTVEKTAYEQIILPLLDDGFQGFEIKKKNIPVQIRSKEVKVREKRELLDKFYSSECSHFLNLEFLTPTSFKKEGHYVIIPDLNLIFQSMMNKYSASCTDMEMYDEDVLEELVKNSTIVNYKLNSTYFQMEGIRIPSFRGKIGIKISGTDTIAKYARFLAEFGEYSGVGIKTAMGMGAVKLLERGKRND